MRLRILLALVVTTVLAGCGDATSTTAPGALRPQGPQFDLMCRSGYHVATRADGTQYCAPDQDPESLRSAPTFRP